jgi:L-asparaginase II
VAYVHVLRGGLLESRHRVHAAVVRPDGSLVASLGDPGFSSYLRSSAKAFQALPFIPTLERYGLGSRHLAIAMASHAGEAVHVQTVQEILEHAGIDPDWLVCGIHAPFNDQARAELRARGERPSVLHNNCSGKHVGMIAASLARGWGHAGYQNADHPLQQEILAGLGELFGLDRVETAVDGCSVPCFRVPMHNAALGMARLADPKSAPETYRDRLEIAFAAMRAYPLLIAGTGRTDTVLMTHIPGLVSKIGAEAFIALAARETDFGPIGITIKIEDGAERALSVAALAVLEQLGLCDTTNPAFLGLAHPITKNVAGLEVGELRANFELEWKSEVRGQGSEGTPS